MVTFGVIGPGNLGEALLRKISINSVTYFYHYRPDRCQDLEKKGLGQSRSLVGVLDADIAFITTKPTLAKEICSMIKPHLAGRSPLFISVMTGVSTSFLCNHLGTSRVARMMFDISVGELHLARQIFAYAVDNLRKEITRTCSIIGRIIWLDEESKIDMATAVFGCGPAFIARFFQAYLETTKKFGFDSEGVKDLVLDLFDATIYMLGNGQSASLIIEKVACKGGATERGLQYLNGLDNSLAQCIGVAEKRCCEIREEFS